MKAPLIVGIVIVLLVGCKRLPPEEPAETDPHIIPSTPPVQMKLAKKRE